MGGGRSFCSYSLFFGVFKVVVFRFRFTRKLFVSGLILDIGYSRREFLEGGGSCRGLEFGIRRVFLICDF